MPTMISPQPPSPVKKAPPKPVTVGEPDRPNHKPLLHTVPLDDVVKTIATSQTPELKKPAQAQLASHSPFHRAETYLLPQEADILRINQRPTQQQDLERAKQAKHKNRLIRNIGILGLTAIGALAVTFAALQNYLWSPKKG